MDLLRKVGALSADQRAEWRTEDRKGFEGRERVDQGKKTLGVDHPNTVGVNLDALGRGKEAEELLRQMAATIEEVFGADHVDTAGALNNLALNLSCQGQTDVAEQSFRRARGRQ
jgi:hypothetical protein